jgi:hypothetical protein
MSSATSINGTDAERLPNSKSGKAGPPDPRESTMGAGSFRSKDDSLQPWHFFVLLSLITATAAVVLAREARPEHLVLISLTIGAAGFAGATLYRTLSPLVRKEEVPPPGALSDSLRAVLEREKMLVLRSIKELEFDRAMGKLSAKDFDEMAGRLRARAMSVMRQLDSGSGYRELIERELQARLHNPATRVKRRGSKEPRPTSAAPEPSHGAVKSSDVEPGSADPGRCTCGTQNDVDAAFCKRCGSRLDVAGGAQA